MGYDCPSTMDQFIALEAPSLKTQLVLAALNAFLQAKLTDNITKNSDLLKKKHFFCPNFDQVRAI